MITGFNTDIEHDGVVYHVQTEDKGLDSPIILSLVYAGGAILASKRSPYKDLIAEGFSDEVLAERLKRQHRLICAAIHGGRLDDLKRMSGREATSAFAEIEIPEQTQEIVIEESPVEVELELELETPPQSPVEIVTTPTEAAEPVAEQDQAPPVSDYTPEADAYTVHDSRREETEAEPVAGEEGLALTLLTDEEFHSGDAPTLRVLVCDKAGQDFEPLANVPVSVKILGTTFRPLIYSLRTEKDGVAAVSTEIPHFTSGRAAVLVRAVAKGKAAELRRVIHPGK